MVYFYANKGKQFLCGHSILTEGVFVTQLPSNVGDLSLTNCVGFDKLLFYGAMRSISLIQLWDLLSSSLAVSNEKALLTQMYGVCSASYYWYVVAVCFCHR